jgi:hypothetical protein
MHRSLILVCALAACDDYAPDQFVATSCPSEAAFAEHVSPLFERRCGTLDCHGETARPLRIYGRLGLRYDEALAGGDATTDEERHRNWLATCGLEPELTHRVVTGTALPDELVIVRKPLAVVDEDAEVSGEHHKGGPVLERGADGYRCLTSWLAGDVDADACTTAESRYR